VLGVLSIVFGSLLAVLAGLLGMLVLAQHRDRIHPDPEAVPAAVMFLVLAASAAALVPLGVGQLRYRRWARVTTLIWAVAALVLLVSEIVGFLTVVRDKEAAAGLALLWGIALSPYPVLLLVFFSRQAIAEVMQG
jgi:spore maturation protein SpmA